MTTKAPSVVFSTRRTSSLMQESVRTACQSLPLTTSPDRRSPSNEPPWIRPTRRKALGVLPMTSSGGTCSRNTNNGPCLDTLQGLWHAFIQGSQHDVLVSILRIECSCSYRIGQINPNAISSYPHISRLQECQQLLRQRFGLLLRNKVA